MKKFILVFYPLILFLLTITHFLILAYFSMYKIYLEGIFSYIFIFLYTIILIFIGLSLSKIPYKKKYLLVLVLFLLVNAFDLLTTFFSIDTKELSVTYAITIESIQTSSYLLNQKMSYTLIVISAILQKLVMLFSSYSLIVISLYYYSIQKKNCSIKKIFTMININTICTMVLTYNFFIKQLKVVHAVMSNILNILYSLNYYPIYFEVICNTYYTIVIFLFNQTLLLFIIIPLVKIATILIGKINANTNQKKSKKLDDRTQIVLLTTVGSELEYLQIANVLEENNIPFYRGGGSSISQGSNMDGRIFIKASSLDCERAKELINSIPIIKIESCD